MASVYIINGKLVLDISDASKQFKNLQQDVEDVKKKSKQTVSEVKTDWVEMGKSMSNVGSKLTKSITLPLVAVGAAAVKLSSDLTETMGKAEVVFGDSFSAVEKWANGSIGQMGLAKESALSAASTFGDLATSMDIGQGAAANMSMDLTQLAADMASFKNISVERAQVALNGIFTGETESLKTMGIVMKENTLEQFAMNEGIGKTYKEMSQTEKVMLRYRFVMNSTKNAQGDFARTSDSVANQTRSMGERLKEVGANFGDVLAPMVGKALAAVNNFLTGILNMDEGQKQTIVTIGAVIAIVPVLILAIGKAIAAYEAYKAVVIAGNLATGNWIEIIGLAVGAATLIATSLFGAGDAAGYTKEQFDSASAGLDNLSKIKPDISITENTADVNEKIGTTQTNLNTLDGTNPSSVVSANTADANTNIATTQSNLDTLDSTNPEVPIAVIKDPEKFNLDTIKTELEALPKSQSVTIEVDTSLPTEAVSAIAGLFSTEGDLRQNVKATVADISSIATEAKAAIDSLVELQLTQIWTKFLNGELEAEEALGRINALVGQATEKKGEIDGEVKAVGKLLNQVSQDRKITVEELNKLKEEFKGSSKDIETTSKTTEQITREASTNILANENANMAATTETIESVKTALSQYAADSDTYLTQASGIWETHTEEISKVAPMYEGEITAAQNMAKEAKTNSENMVSAYGSYYELRNTAGIEENAAMLIIEQQYGKDIASQMAIDFGIIEGLRDGNYMAILDQQQAYIDSAELKRKTADDMEKTKEEEIAARKQKINSETYIKLQLLQLKYNTATLEQYQAYAEKEGIEYDATAVNNARIVSEMYDNIQTNTTGDLEDLGTITNKGLQEIITIMDNQAAAAGKSGTNTGVSYIDGEIAGIDSKKSDLYKKIKEVQEAAIKAGQKAIDSNSPSRKTAKLLGKPMIEGIGVGFDDGLVDVIKKVKKGTSDIISGASKKLSDTSVGIKASTQSNARALQTTQANNIINQHNTFTTKTLTPYEQRIQLKKLDNDLAGVFA